MGRGLRGALCAAVVTAGVAVAPVSASAQEVPDASCGPRNFNNNFNQSWKTGQVFTALNTGQLTSARAEVGKETGSSGDFVFEILEVDANGDPTDTVLASTTVSDAGVVDGAAFPAALTQVTATFTTPAAVVAGEQYALAVSRPSTGPFWAGFRTSSTCPGEGYVRISGWGENSPNVDLVYDVFVTPGPPQIGAVVAPNGTCNADITLIQPTAPDDQYEAPSAGVITSWRYQAFTNGGSLRLKVVRPVSGFNYATVGQSEIETAVANQINSYSTRIPVQAGDVIGAYLQTDGLGCNLTPRPGYVADFVSGDPPPGNTVLYAPGFNGQMPVSAVLEPDADNDGFGDQTQDQCLGSPGPNNGCPDPAPGGGGESPEPEPQTPPQDTDPPETTITKGPPDKGEKNKVKYKFVADEPSTFECKADKGEFEPCGSPEKLKVDDGKHKFQVVATDLAENRDPTPGKDKFKVVD
jgi:hypothetical protein